MCDFSKILGGRWILTVACAGVFVYCSVSGKLSNEAIASILSMVFVSYFNRTPTKEVKTNDQSISRPATPVTP